MEDLGPNSDCGESESQTDSETGNNIETKVSLQGEIKEKVGMEPPESSVQQSMTKTCDIDIVVQGSLVQRETKDNRNVEQESSGQHDKERINDKAVDEKEFLIREEIKEKPDADKESSVEEIQNEIKDKGKNSEGVTNDVHIELKIFPCTASNKRKEIGSENTKE